MMEQKSFVKRVGILAKDGFEQKELTECRSALLEMGVQVHIISLEPGSIISWNNKKWGIEVAVDKTLKEAQCSDYDALIIPGGHFNPGVLLQNQQALNFVKCFFNPKLPKPVAAIRQGTLMLIEAGVVSGRIVTSYINTQTQLRFSNAKLIDKDLVIDKDLLTSRSSDNLRFMHQTILEKLQHSLMHKSRPLNHAFQ